MTAACLWLIQLLLVKFLQVMFTCLPLRLTVTLIYLAFLFASHLNLVFTYIQHPLQCRCLCQGSMQSLLDFFLDFLYGQAVQRTRTLSIF